MRLDRLVGKWGGWGKRRTRKRFVAGEVRLNGRIVLEGNRVVGAFDQVKVGNGVVQARERRAVMLHKPAGVVSATVDEEHPTVIDLIQEEWAGDLHLAGRLDRFSTGLVILTNDSVFSESLTEPQRKVGKSYLVEVDGEIVRNVIEKFEEGIWFEKEGVRTEPSELELLGKRRCRLTIFEGKHHQVKRMFARYGLKVISLHREAIGEYSLGDLGLGEWKEL